MNKAIFNCLLVSSGLWMLKWLRKKKDQGRVETKEQGLCLSGEEKRAGFGFQNCYDSDTCQWRSRRFEKKGFLSLPRSLGPWEQRGLESVGSCLWFVTSSRVPWVGHSPKKGSFYRICGVDVFYPFLPPFSLTKASSSYIVSTLLTFWNGSCSYPGEHPQELHPAQLAFIYFMGQFCEVPGNLWITCYPYFREKVTLWEWSHSQVIDGHLDYSEPKVNVKKKGPASNKMEYLQ